MVKGIGVEIEAGELTVEPLPRRAHGTQESRRAMKETTGHWRAHARPGGARTHCTSLIYPDPCDLHSPPQPAHGAPQLTPLITSLATSGLPLPSLPELLGRRWKNKSKDICLVSLFDKEIKKLGPREAVKSSRKHGLG